MLINFPGNFAAIAKLVFDQQYVKFSLDYVCCAGYICKPLFQTAVPVVEADVLIIYIFIFCSRLFILGLFEHNLLIYITIMALCIQPRKMDCVQVEKGVKH